MYYFLCLIAYQPTKYILSFCIFGYQPTKYIISFCIVTYQPTKCIIFSVLLPTSLLNVLSVSLATQCNIFSVLLAHPSSTDLLGGPEYIELE